MGAALVPIVVTEDWSRPDGTTPTGKVTFYLLGAILSPQYVTPNTIPTLLTGGQIAQLLYALDADSLGNPLDPSTLQYRVVEEVLGADSQEWYATVPASPPGSRAVADAATVKGSQTVTSATAAFTDDDEGAYVLLAGFPLGTRILAVTNSTTVLLSAGSTDSNAAGVDLLIGASVALSSMRPPE